MTKQVIFVLLLAIALSIAAVVLKGRGRRGARGDIRPRCWVPCDHVPVRSWALFKARDVLRELIRTLKAEQSAAQVA